MRVYSHLKEIMRARSMSVVELHHLTGVARQAISHLRQANLRRVDLNVAARICCELNITLDDLFELVPEDIWAPIRA